MLARRLGRPFIDLDARIVAGAGRSIREIFETEGVDAFRVMERAALAALKSEPDCVVALGGGAVEADENRKAIRRFGRVVWLRAPAVALWPRIRDDAATKDARPDLTPEGGLAEVRTLLDRRDPAYAKIADHVVDTATSTPDEVAEVIELWFRAGDSVHA